MGGRESKRIVELDALRGLAAVAVIGYHYTYQLWEIAPLDERPAFSLSRGNYGVQLFFVVSGFVIAGSVSRSRGAADFAVLRFARLFPTYWAAVLLTTLVVGVIGLDGAYVSAPNTLVNLTMLQHHARIDHVDGAYWSLAVELSFYVIAYAASALGWLRPSRLAVTLSAWIALACVWSLLPVNQLTERLDDLLVLRWAHLFAAGIALAALAAHRSGASDQPLTVRNRRLLVGVVSLGPLAEILHESVGSALIETGLVALVATAVFARPAALRLRPLVWLGGVSYALYLVHQNIGYVVIRELSGAGTEIHVAIAAATVMVLVLAWALTELVDGPARRWIRAWWRGRNPQPTRQVAG